MSFDGAMSRSAATITSCRASPRRAIAEDALALLVAFVDHDTDELAFRVTLILMHAQQVGCVALGEACNALLGEVTGPAAQKPSPMLPRALQRVIVAAADTLVGLASH